jgi:protein phosphatase
MAERDTLEMIGEPATFGGTEFGGTELGATELRSTLNSGWLRRPELSGATHHGQRRSSNEDHFLIAELRRQLNVSSASLLLDDELFETRSQGWLLVVADGIGGQAKGELASRLAVQTFARELLCHLPWEHDDGHTGTELVVQSLRSAVRLCESAIEQRARSLRSSTTPGTTLTAAYVTWPRMYIVHAGDSRCYVLGSNGLRRMTIDHTVAGSIGARDAKRMGTPMSHVLLNGVGGTGLPVEPVVSTFEMNTGDVVFLCSDGVSACLADEELSEMLTKVRTRAWTSDRCVAAIIDESNERGGPDNITAVVGCF